MLIEHGADVNAVDMFGQNALREAIGAGNPEMTRFLLQVGCKPDHVNKDGKSMRDLANEFGTTEIKEIFSSISPSQDVRSGS
jgi:ankyrin repeat protein